MTQTCLLITDDDQSYDLISAAAAALDVVLVPLSARDPIAAHWAKADRILLGADAAATVAGLGLPERGGVSVLVTEQRQDEGVRWSGALRAPLVQIPDVGGQLAQALGVHGSGARSVPLVVVGASGGLGASTLAAGLACSASQQGRALLLDLDPGGGGLDLVLGVEGQPGWRWPDLVEASGDFSLTAEQLPSWSGVSVISTSRGDSPQEPTLAGVSSIMRAARRGFDEVVVDCRREDIDAIAMLNGRTVVVVGGHVRGLAAARGLLASLAEAGIGVQLVLRRGMKSGVGLDAAERALGQPLLAEVPTDRRLAFLAEQGAAPWAGTSRRWRRRLSQIYRGNGQRSTYPGLAPETVRAVALDERPRAKRTTGNTVGLGR